MVDPQSGAIKRRGCVYSGICLSFSFSSSFFPPLPLLHHWNRATARFLSYSRRRSRRIYALSVVARPRKREGEEGTGKVEIEESEKDGWRRVEGKKAEESRCNYFRSSSWTDFKLVVQGRLVDQGEENRGDGGGKEEGEGGGWRPERRINLVKPGESVTKTLKWSMGMRDIYRSKSVGWKRSHRSTVLGRRDTNGIFIISPQRPTPLADNGPTVWSIGRVTALTASHLFFFVSETRLDRRASQWRPILASRGTMGRDRWKWIYLGEEGKGEMRSSSIREKSSKTWNLTRSW